MAVTSLQPTACSKCGNLSDTFVDIDPAMRSALQESGQAGPIPDRVCSTCFEQLTSAVSQGLKLRLEATVREKNKMLAWKNRVHLIKNARNLMNQKAYSEAAVQYEKYLRVLELVYNLKKGDLSPAVFNNSSRSKELTVIASVYWDLMRIYDTSPRYTDRMSYAGQKLTDFLKYSPIYPDIVKKAEAFSKSCKNPVIMRQFLRGVRARRGPCFIATAVFPQNAPELTILRRYRDEVLRPTPFGRRAIWIYYRLSPRLAAWIGRSQLKSRYARRLLTKIAWRLNKNLKTH
jgi:hypothetical protein